MSGPNETAVLAIGIDAGESTVIRRMIDHDELPVLKSLLSEGKWISIESPLIGGSSVWPTFVTGEDPAAHGIYAEWCWEPATMNLSRFTGRNLTPFWKPLAEEGITCGVLAVPFMPFVGLSAGFEISEWGPFLLLEDGMQFGPSGITDLVKGQTSAHPLAHRRLDVSGPDDYVNLHNLVSASLEGVRLRATLAERLLTETKPNVSVIVFTEAHVSGHYLWNTVEPDNELYQGDIFKSLRAISPTFENIY